MHFFNDWKPIKVPFISVFYKLCKQESDRVNVVGVNRDNKEPHNWLLNTALKQNTYRDIFSSALAYEKGVCPLEREE